MSYQTDPQLRVLQLAELDICRVFVSLCEKHQLPYYMLGGTLLGAVRHKGFIPWDDDIDLCMPRPDYERFLQLAEADLPEGYHLVTYRNHDDHLRYFARIESDKAHVLETGSVESHVNAAWIDIFPLDGMPSGLRGRLHGLHLLVLRALFQFSQFDQLVNLNLPHRPLHERLLIAFGKVTHFGRHLSPRKVLDRLDRALKRYDFAAYPQCVNFMGAYKLRETFRRTWLGSGTLLPFEDTQLAAPQDYDAVLTQLYGCYMQPPPESERNKHQTQALTE